MDPVEKKQLISRFIQQVVAASSRALDAKDALELGIPEQQLLNEFSQEFKEAMWLYNRVMAMNDAKPLAEHIPTAVNQTAREWAIRG